MAKSKFLGLLFASGMTALAMGPGSALADDKVRVTFVQPESYTDAGDDARGRSAATLKTLNSYFETLGARYIQPGQTLAIEVLDIDLAGRFEPWRPAARDVRILLPITWPTIKLRYTLLNNGQPIGQGEERISDLNYQTRLDARISNDPLRYEKSMLHDWFKARFAAVRLPAS